VDEAAEQLGRVNADYRAHSRAARDVAERVFDYRIVLPQLVRTALGERRPSADVMPSGFRR
jgi:hypothetical protein